jgi:hypothetical protein
MAATIVLSRPPEPCWCRCTTVSDTSRGQSRHQHSRSPCLLDRSRMFLTRTDRDCLKVRNHAISVTDHPGSLRRKAFGGHCLRMKLLGSCARTTAAGRRMTLAAFWRMRAAFIHLMRSSLPGIGPGQRGGGEQRSGCVPTAFLAGPRLLKLRHWPYRGKRPAVGAEIVINRHDWILCFRGPVPAACRRRP